MKTTGLDKILGRIDDLDSVNLSILVQRLARDRKLQIFPGSSQAKRKIERMK